MAPPPHRLTPASAAMTLALWMQTHQKVPKAHECIPANGLPHWTTIYRTFSSMQGYVSAACALQAALSTLLSAPAATPCPQITIACLGGCGRQITVPRQKPLRHCRHCRRNLFRRSTDDGTTTFVAHIVFDDTWDDIDWDPF